MDRKIKSAIAGVGMSVLAALPDDAHSFDLEKFPKDANPAQVSELLRPSTLAKGLDSESVAMTLSVGTNFISEARNPNRQSIIPGDVIEQLIATLEQRAGGALTGQELWMTHSHPAKVITAFWLRNGVKANEIRYPDRLLNGPAFTDCNRIFEVKAKHIWLRDKTYNIVNVIVEPGGTWICSGQPKPISIETEHYFTDLRKKLLRASQNKTGKALRDEISGFERAASEILGIQIRFLPNKSSMPEYEKARAMRK